MKTQLDYIQKTINNAMNIIDNMTLTGYQQFALAAEAMHQLDLANQTVQGLLKEEPVAAPEEAPAKPKTAAKK